jgi:hypothetical protein
LIIGVPTLLFLAATYNLLSPREWAFGMIAWFATLLFWASIAKRAEKNAPTSSAEQTNALDDNVRNRILRNIRIRKVWIVALVVLLPIGIANGATHHAWLPTLAGVGMSLMIIYVEVRAIKHQQERLTLTRK